MFDYQAGEKYKLTLIMVGTAGLMAGMFFSILLMPPSAPPPRKMASKRHMTHPDVTGYAPGPAQSLAANTMAEAGIGGPGAANAAPAAMCDPYQAKTLMDSWLPLSWDLSAGTARASQEQAIAYMTPECAAAYRQNIWTADLAKQIEEAGLQSSFQITNMNVGQPLPDGTLIVKVSGNQTLGAAGQGKQRQVQLEYLLRQTPQGIRIAGISEGT